MASEPNTIVNDLFLTSNAQATKKNSLVFFNTCIQ